MSPQFRQTLRVETKIMTSATPLFFDKTRGFQHLKMLRHSGTTDGKLIGQFANREWPLPQQVENALARRVRECSQHLFSVSHDLP